MGVEKLNKDKLLVELDWIKASIKICKDNLQIAEEKTGELQSRIESDLK